MAKYLIFGERDCVFSELLEFPLYPVTFEIKSKSGDISKNKMGVAGVHLSGRVVANSTADSSVRVSFETTLPLVRMYLFGNPHCAKSVYFKNTYTCRCNKRIPLAPSALAFKMLFPNGMSRANVILPTRVSPFGNLVVQWPSVSKSRIRTVILINN